MTPKEWKETPWWEQEAYVDGFREEGILSGGDEPEPEGTSVRPSVDADPVAASDEDWRAMGLTVINGGKSV